MKTVSEIKEILDNEFIIIDKDINRTVEVKVIAINYNEDEECYEVTTNTTTVKNFVELEDQIIKYKVTNHPFDKQILENQFSDFGEKDYFYSEPEFKVGDTVTLQYTDNVEDFTIVR